MKSSLIFAVAFAVPCTLAANYGSIQGDTWCVTYLSTYLAAVPNGDDSSSGINAPDAMKTETARLPVPPSIRPTFGRNTSVAFTQSITASANPGLTETSQLKLPGSDSTVEGVSTPNADATETQFNSNPSSVQTTTATSATSEPNGQAIILLVSISNQRRYKRATGGFVGNENPDICTFAATFNLANGQLFEGGIQIYYSGEDYKELSGLDMPPSGATTRGFTLDGQMLVFRNTALPHGEAGFCQDSNGKVYITFVTTPPGCTTITLNAYDVAQCQNGVLVGVDDLGSSTSEISTSTTVSSATTTSYQLKTSLISTADAGEATFVTKTSTELDVVSFLSSQASSETSDPIESTTLPGDTTKQITTSDISATIGPSTAEGDGTTIKGATSTTEYIAEETSTLELLTTIESSTTDYTFEESTSTIESSTLTTEDPCVAAVTSTGGLISQEEKSKDCQEANIVTVSPYTVTQTILSKRWEYRIPTGWPTPRPSNKQIARRQDEPTATTIFPTDIPEYIDSCDSADEYFDACSSLGATRTTTTLPTPTTTVTDDEPACRAASMVKRAGEAVGYEFEDDWDVIRMPGWRYF